MNTLYENKEIYIISNFFSSKKIENKFILINKLNNIILIYIKCQYILYNIYIYILFYLYLLYLNILFPSLKTNSNIFTVLLFIILK